MKIFALQNNIGHRIRLDRKFFEQPTLKVAKSLLGKYLVRIWRGKEIIGKIVETEAYIGPGDKASHAYYKKEFTPKGLEKIYRKFEKRIPIWQRKKFKEEFLKRGGKITNRSLAEFLTGGHIYIYLVYGMYWQLNISTGKAGQPECMLIRAVEPITDNLKLITYNLKHLTNGPGKLCNYFKLDKTFYGEDLCKSKRIWLEDLALKRASKTLIVSGPRIGIDYAGPYWAKKPWRFWIKKNPFVSKYRAFG